MITAEKMYQKLISRSHSGGVDEERHAQLMLPERSFFSPSQVPPNRHMRFEKRNNKDEWTVRKSVIHAPHPALYLAFFGTENVTSAKRPDWTSKARDGTVRESLQS